MQSGLVKPTFFIDRFVLGIGIFTVLILAIAVFIMSKYSTVTPLADKAQTEEILSVKSDDWVKGSENAPITIIEYLDFECEACRSYYPTVKQLKEEYKDDIRFVVRYFPLPGHKNSMPAAQAVEAAGKQGKFWEMHDILYENQKVWGEKSVPDPKIFEGYANQIGLNMEQYKKDVISKEVRDRVNRDKTAGNSLGIKGTPTFFINGEKIPNPKGYEDFKSLIDGLKPQAQK